MTRHHLLSLVTILTLMFVGMLSSPVSADTTAQRSAAPASVPFVRVASGPTTRQRQCTHPTFGFPTCYSLQADGLWAREELTIDETGANWEVFGTATLDEVTAAVGEMSATAP